MRAHTHTHFQVSGCGPVIQVRASGGKEVELRGRRGGGEIEMESEGMWGRKEQKGTRIKKMTPLRQIVFVKKSNFF